MQTLTPTFRFAPSPNGRLHAGHAYSALHNASLAARLGGRFLVRIEDIDTTRCTQALTDACLDDLAWLGLAWEQPVRVQSRHFVDYRTAASILKAQGLLYPCACTRSEIARTSTGNDPDGAPLYPGTCRHLPEHKREAMLASGVPVSWRLDMEKACARHRGPYSYIRFDPVTFAQETVAADPSVWGDVILVRKETPASYHLCVVLDDAMQEVTHVVRGTDLEAATALHLLLQSALLLPTPFYHHHALVTLGTGEKLSKSKGAETLAELRAKGVTPADLREMLGIA